MLTPPPSAAYMRQDIRQWTGLSLVQVMACRLVGARPLPEPTLSYCQLDPKEQFQIQIQTFSLIKMHFKMSSAQWRPFFQEKMS